MIENTLIQKSFYFSFCSNDEAERIIAPQNAKDFLLQLRANTVADHMRLLRVYMNYARIYEKKGWSFEKSFDESHYNDFIQLMTDEERLKCESITYGNVFSNDPNGYVWESEFGPMITISESLRFFLKFAHLALMDFKDRVPYHVRSNALRIALRVMLKTETLDFLMDPRGILPEDISEAIHDPIQYQMQFIAGHEFGHFLLGHLDKTNTTKRPLYFSISPMDTQYGEVRVYNQSQKQEFEADLFSLSKAEKMGDEYRKFFEAALVWFGALELFETLCDTLYPANSNRILTHPRPKERFFNIIENASIPTTVNLEDWFGFIGYVDLIKEHLMEDLSINCDTYETYGSVYFDKPDTEWRGKELRDRVDYY